MRRRKKVKNRPVRGCIRIPFRVHQAERMRNASTEEGDEHHRRAECRSVGYDVTGRRGSVSTLAKNGYTTVARFRVDRCRCRVPPQDATGQQSKASRRKM
ncbi:hypothetical protein TNCV_3695891 [Trichonephila clavipes]|nr:hypothetical protein TNCV_3695891 [Trichonephila clavipes]